MDQDQQVDIVWELRFRYLKYTLTKKDVSQYGKNINQFENIWTNNKRYGPEKKDIDHWSISFGSGQYLVYYFKLV